MKKQKKTNKRTSKRTSKRRITTLIVILIIVILGILTGVGININIQRSDNSEITIELPKASIKFADESNPAIMTKGEATIEGVETGQGAIGEEVTVESIDGYNVPTVESVEATTPVTEINDVECPEGEECGRGAYYPTIDISTPQAFANATLGVCLDVDGYYGAQCWDSMSAFFYNYAGRILQTCGTGAAKGTIADGCWQKNAGSEFTMIWNPEEIQAGDIAVYSTGQWGHIGMAMGNYNHGYFTLLGQNQGGSACAGGGAAGNIINLSTRDFIGAFRPNIYIKPAPAPEPDSETVNPCKVRNVVKGDTLGKIMLECTGEIKWGEAMNDYARHWVSTIINNGNTVYYGWTHGTGYGLFADDVIEYRD